MSRSVGHTCSPDEAELEYANLTGARAGGLESQHAQANTEEEGHAAGRGLSSCEPRLSERFDK